MLVINTLIARLRTSQNEDTLDVQRVRSSTGAMRHNMTHLMALSLLLAFIFSCMIPEAQGFAILEDKSSLEPNDYEDDDLVRKMELLDHLLEGRQIRLPSAMMTSLQNAKHDERRLVAGKRGPTSCINNCLTSRMSYVRCKSMCHW